MKNFITSLLFALLLAGCTTLPDLKNADKAFKAGDYATAAAQWKTLSEYGYPEAQMKLARLYEKGHGVEKNETLAETYYLKAAAQNYSRAMFDLARFYERKKMKDQALDYYTQSARLGHARAQEKVEKLKTTH